MCYMFNDLLVVYIVFSLIIIISMLILSASYFFGVQKPDPEKVSLYECGFDPYGDSRDSFNIRFYIIAILFIIFDLETVLLLPWAITLSNIASFGFWIGCEFLIELVMGFIYILNVGVLEWE